MSDELSSNENALQPVDQQKLKEAERLYQDEKPGQAAPLFAVLADKLTYTHPRRSATLHAQAAQAFVQSRNENSALTQARAAFNLFIQYRMGQAADFYYKSIRSEMTDHNMQNAAAALEKEFVYRLNFPFLHPESETVPSPPLTPAIRLPTNCPHCGAPVHINDVNWVDASTAECAYCATPLQPLD